MSNGAIADEIVGRELVSTISETPPVSVAVTIRNEVLRGDDSRIVKLRRGLYALRSQVEPPARAQAQPRKASRAQVALPLPVAPGRVSSFNDWGRGFLAATRSREMADAIIDDRSDLLSWAGSVLDGLLGSSTTSGGHNREAPVGLIPNVRICVGAYNDSRARVSLYSTEAGAARDRVEGVATALEKIAGSLPYGAPFYNDSSERKLEAGFEWSIDGWTGAQSAEHIVFTIVTLMDILRQQLP